MKTIEEFIAESHRIRISRGPDRIIIAQSPSRGSRAFPPRSDEAEVVFSAIEGWDIRHVRGTGDAIFEASRPVPYFSLDIAMGAESYRYPDIDESISGLDHLLEDSGGFKMMENVVLTHHPFNSMVLSFTHQPPLNIRIELEGGHGSDMWFSLFEDVYNAWHEADDEEMLLFAAWQGLGTWTKRRSLICIEQTDDGWNLRCRDHVVFETSVRNGVLCYAFH